MSILRRERRSFPEPFVAPFPGMSIGGKSVSPSMETAMRVGAVWACVRLIADTVSMMPLHAFTMQSGIRVPISDPPLLVRPSADASMPDWIYMVLVSLLLRGNAYGQIVARDGYGFPVQIELIDPDRVMVKVGNDGLVTYSTRAGGAISPRDLLHIRAYRMPGLTSGLSPIKYAAAAINTDAAISDFALGYFQDAPHPSSVLTSDQSINQDAARTIKDRFIASVTGREPLILGAGLKFSTLSVSPEESQFLATQKYGVASIARIFGVPPEMIAAEAGNSMTYANVEQRGIDFLTYTAQPWLTRIESALAPLMPAQRHARFDTSALIRTDLETRVKAGAIAIASKQATPDEVRAWSDLPPLTDEQKAWLEIIPLEVSPTGMPKAVPMALTPTSAPNTDPAATDGNPNA